MDEVRVERLIQKYKDSGELVSEDPALVMLKKWPALKQYQNKSDRLPGLEQLVCLIDNGIKFGNSLICSIFWLSRDCSYILYFCTDVCMPPSCKSTLNVNLKTLVHLAPKFFFSLK